MTERNTMTEPEKNSWGSFEEVLENVAKLSLSNSKTKVEPSATDREQAKSIRQSYIAYMDEGFSSAEAMDLSTVPMREMVRYVIERSDENDQGGT